MHVKLVRVVIKNENYEYANKHLIACRDIIFTHIASIATSSSGPTGPKFLFTVVILIIIIIIIHKNDDSLATMCRLMV